MEPTREPNGRCRFAFYFWSPSLWSDVPVSTTFPQEANLFIPPPLAAVRFKVLGLQAINLVLRSRLAADGFITAGRQA